MIPTVVILASGKGTRMGPYAKIINKALLPLQQKAIISHIIDKFPRHSRFIITLGYLGKQVKQYLTLAYSELNIEFVEVDNYDGQGSGPGYSLLCCKSVINTGFYFVSCDTLWDNALPIDIDHDWLGVAEVNKEDQQHYCNVILGDDNQAIDLKDKAKVAGQTSKAFIGLAYFKNYKAFFAALEKPTLVSNEHQVSSGIIDLINNQNVLTYAFDWRDLGTFENYRSAIMETENFDFSKSSEFLYIVNQTVIKFFHDESITDKRVRKASLNPHVFPKIRGQQGQFYSYKYLDGSTLYHYNNSQVFENFLNWCEVNLWKKPAYPPENFQQSCLAFYQSKTCSRLDRYYSKTGTSDMPSVVNGLKIDTTKSLLDNIEWANLTKGIPTFFHGDLQFDNIIYDQQKNQFILLDWRQDFEGHIDVGDKYYDLAKLHGGIILNYDLIKQGLLSYAELNNGEVWIDFAQRFSTSRYLDILNQFLTKHRLDTKKVKMLTGLIYLNMAPLHHEPFDRLLYSLGRLTLHTELKNY